jgi:hypothetical protein
MIKKYRKKPVVISAVQWTGDNLREIIDFTGRHPSAKEWSWEEFEQVAAKDGLKIFTLEGSHLASIGDYIIRGVQSEYYPCKPDIFHKTYECLPEPCPNCGQIRNKNCEDGICPTQKKERG